VRRTREDCNTPLRQVAEADGGSRRWTPPPRDFASQFPVRNELRKRVLRRLRVEGIAIPYPSRPLYLRGGGHRTGRHEPLRRIPLTT